MSNTFQGLHAAHYDLIYAEKPYAEEARFVGDLLGGPGTLLDIACGTGRHALEFAELGYDVTGIDYNELLLERARERAERGGRKIDFLAADMRKLDLGRTFDSVTCLFDSIGYPGTNEGIVAALSSAGRHLTPEGTLVVEFLHAPAMLTAASPVRVRRWELPGGGRLLRVSETEIDAGHSLMRVSYELLELQPDGAGYSSGSEEQSNRFFSLEEMRALMSAAGLEVRSFVPAYGADETIDERIWHVIAVAGRAGG